MEHYDEISENLYRDFIRWAKDNVEGLHSESIMVADRVLIKDGKGNSLAYVDLAYPNGRRYFLSLRALKLLME